MKILTFKKKIGMIAEGEWVVVCVREHKKIDNHCMLSVYQKDLRVIGLLEEQVLLAEIENGNIEVGKKSKYIYKSENVKKGV